MPHTESVARDYKDSNVVVLAVCTSDSKSAYEKWMPTHQPNFPDMTFTFDPAGSGEDRVAKALYDVGGIPTQFVIGADGVIKSVIVGFYADDLRLEAGLSKAGVQLDGATLAKVQQLEKANAEKMGNASADAKAKAAEEAKKPTHDQFGSLKAGDAVSQFAVAGADGRSISLSDFRGKTIVLGFWTAANPTGIFYCTAAMPHLSDLAARYKGNGVVVLNVCTLTPRSVFDSWLAENNGKYAFVAAYDPAGIPAKEAGVKPLYRMLAGKPPGYLRMPETLVINAEGKFVGCAFAENVAGAGLAMLLQQSGVVLASEDLPKAPAPVPIAAN
jgi:peroxiredoxin